MFLPPLVTSTQKQRRKESATAALRETFIYRRISFTHSDHRHWRQVRNGRDAFHALNNGVQITNNIAVVTTRFLNQLAQPVDCPRWATSPNLVFRGGRRTHVCTRQTIVRLLDTTSAITASSDLVRHYPWSTSIELYFEQLKRTSRNFATSRGFNCADQVVLPRSWALYPKNKCTHNHQWQFKLPVEPRFPRSKRVPMQLSSLGGFKPLEFPTNCREYLEKII